MTLALHTMTTRPWSLEEALRFYPQHGIGGISIWREHLAGLETAAARRQLDDSGLLPVSLVRGGFFPAASPAARRAAFDENRRALDEAQVLGLPLLVLVCGADPAQSRASNLGQIREGLEELLPHANAAGVKLAVEPLHPVYAPARSAINTLRCANDLLDQIGAAEIGIAWDVYHVWWDHEVAAQTRRSADAGRLLAYHVCDYKENPADPLQDRGLPGKGVADLVELDGLVRSRCGFAGPVEVEIFSAQGWAQDQHEFVKRILESVREVYGDRAGRRLDP